MADEELCAFCSSLNMPYAGYYRHRPAVQDEQDFTGSNEDDNDAEHAGHASGSDDNDNDFHDIDDNDEDQIAHEQDVDAGLEGGWPLAHVGSHDSHDGYGTDDHDEDHDEDHDGDDDDRDSNDSGFEEEEEDDPWRSAHSIPEMLANSRTCRFCRELSRFFFQWVEKTYPGRTLDSLVLADSEVQVEPGACLPAMPKLGSSRPRGGDYEDVSRFSTARVVISMRDPDRPELDHKIYWPAISLDYQRVLWESWPRLQDVLDSMDAHELEGQSALAAWTENEPYSARQRGSRVDMRLLRRWKESCFAWHGDRCRARHDAKDEEQGKMQMLRLIDVEDMCLVEVPGLSTVSWVVLSYVWGRIPFFTLTTANRPDFLVKGSLSGLSSVSGTTEDTFLGLPATVAEAIVATRGLGERYLWTDSLCVVQDSTADKALFVPVMDEIYSRATVAIVDLGGQDAFHGLPGVTTDRFSSTDRDKCHAPEPIVINGTRMVRAAQPTGTGYQRLDMQASCVYLQRGWTFQEALLSRRFVIFTADTVFWECPCATWREDANWEVEGKKEVEQFLDDEDENDKEEEKEETDENQQVETEPDIFRNSFLTVESTVVYDYLWGPSAQDFDKSYQALVHAFTRRKLTFEGDGLAAFSGVLNALERTTELQARGDGQVEQPPLEFIWGLPAPFLGIALTWPVDRDEISELNDDGYPVTDTPPSFYRRTGKCLVFLQDNNSADKTMTTAKIPFPSWSWVGWVAPILYEELFGSLLSAHAGIRFFVFKSADPSADLEEVIQHTAFQDRWPTSDRFVKTEPIWRETSPTENAVDAGMVPEHIRKDPALRQIVLAFWTSCCSQLHIMFEARTKVDGDIANSAEFWEELPGSLTPPTRFSGGWHHRPPRNWHTGLHIVECIVVGRDNLDNLSTESQLVVLVTETVGEADELHGTRRRVAALTVYESAWNSLQTRRWEPVILV